MGRNQPVVTIQGIFRPASCYRAPTGRIRPVAVAGPSQLEGMLLPEPHQVDNAYSAFLTVKKRSRSQLSLHAVSP